MDIQIFLAHTRTQLHTARGQIDAWFEVGFEVGFDAEFDAGSSFLDFRAFVSVIERVKRALTTNP